MSQTYGQMKVRNVSGAAWEHLSAFPFEGCCSQPCVCGRSLRQVCEHVGCRQYAARLHVACSRQSAALQIPAASREPACYHPPAEHVCSLEDLEFFVDQALRFILRTGVQNIIKYSLTSNGMGKRRILLFTNQ